MTFFGLSARLLSWVDFSRDQTLLYITVLELMIHLKQNSSKLCKEVVAESILLADAIFDRKQQTTEQSNEVDQSAVRAMDPKYSSRIGKDAFAIQVLDTCHNIQINISFVFYTIVQITIF
jgi:hypothetical protein